MNRVEKRHRVAILRAADKVTARLWWKGLTSERPGGSIVYCNLLDVHSYALGRLRADFLTGAEPVARLGTFLIEPEPGDPFAHRSRWDVVRPGGAWWLHVEAAKADRAGDSAQAAAIMDGLRADVAARRAAVGLRR